RLARSSGGEKPAKNAVAGVLSSAGKRENLARMLRNLKENYLRFNQLPQALSGSERILLVQPQQGAELRERGMLYQQLECFRAALADFERYLELEPEAQDAEALRERIVELRQAAARIN